MSNCVKLLLCTVLLLQDLSQSLRLVEVRIPNYVIKGSTAQLECLYDLDGESLYSVKWYKDGNEFYRYVPRDMPPAQTFLLPGVSVDVYNSSDAIVTLREVNLQSAGRFRCEVSGEAPSFQTVTEHGDMVVVSLPDQGPPKITGGRPRYQIGDNVRINCTAGRSKPAVQLSWFVNGEPAEPHHVRKYDTIVSGREGLETSVLGLQFRVDQHHFRNGDMKLKCVASLSTFYWRSNEESVEGDRPQKAPVLESRETVYASNSRADPVQANNKTDSSIATIKPSTIILLIVMAVITSSGCFEQLHFNGGGGGVHDDGDGDGGGNAEGDGVDVGNCVDVGTTAAAKAKIAIQSPKTTTTATTATIKTTRTTATARNHTKLQSKYFEKTEMTNKSSYDDRNCNKMTEHRDDGNVGDVSKKLSSEMHFNKDTSPSSPSPSSSSSSSSSASALASSCLMTVAAMPETSDSAMHALNVTTSVSLEQKLALWLYVATNTTHCSTTIPLPSVSAPSNCSPLRQTQCLVAAR